jgi:hypothetical protein
MLSATEIAFTGTPVTDIKRARALEASQTINLI